MIVSLLPLEGGDGLLIPLLPPSSGRRWRVAPEVGFTLFRFQPTPCHGKGVDGLLIPLLPPSSGRRWRVAPEVGFALFFLRPTPGPSGIPLPWEGGIWVTHPSFLWKEVAQSAGGWLRSLSLSANPLPFSPLPWEGGRWATHPTSPSFLWKEVAHSAGGWLRSLSPSANPLPFGHPPSMGRG